ncbi:MAG: tetratricopeptide repeat protein, partial [Pseudonocardiaceae bacterium]
MSSPAEARVNDDDQVRDPHNIVELTALKRMIQRSDGFRIVIAVANHPSLRVRLVDAVRRYLSDVTIAELTLEPGTMSGAVVAIENAARSATGAVFVLGLDRLGSSQARSAVIAELNLNRDYLWRTVRVPVVLWASDFVMREFAQHATDLWSGRSGVYRFRPEGDDSARTVTNAAADISWSRTPEERREREALLRELLNELDETGDDPAVRTALLSALGDAAAMAGRLIEAGDLYQRALPTYREIGDRLGEADALSSLGDVIRLQGGCEKARELYERALLIYGEIGGRLGEANVLRSLGHVARLQGGYAEARELYERALLTCEKLGDRLGEADALSSLGDV